MELHKKSSISYFRNFIFGVEDSLVSTVGLLSGVAVAGIPRRTILLTGVILIFVEAISMAAGSFLSEYSAEEYASQTEKPIKGNLIAGTVMFFSYFVSGFVPLLPYLIWQVDIALYYSVGSSAIALFLLGLVGARMSGTHLFKNGLRIAIVGIIAISIGMIAGNLLSSTSNKNMNGYVTNIEKISLENENFRVVPAGVEHNIINTSDVEMKLYTVYSPPNHRDGVIHQTKTQAEADEEYFDGKTTE